ncbi:MAG: IPT/TIG domain-containing protein [Melioribacteraceae bacterium]|jgi:PBP1b-binding outer membrane lipoprotein LpoB|nr:IPT/TIG domain-containing protein [Melioribacteraceae bacterium]
MKSIISLISLLILILFFSGCGQEPTSTLYENFNSGNNPQPIVTSIEPADSAYMGVDVITINGNYFAPGLLNDSNLVSFNGVKGEIIEATATQLKVRVPMLNTDLMALKDSVVGIKVWSRGSSLFSDSLVYKIKAPVKLYATIDPNVKTINRGITVDQSENLFVSVFNDNVMMITPNGSITDYGIKGGESFWNNLKMGPGNSLHACTEIFWVVFTYDAPNTNPNPLYILPKESAVVKDFDFDKDLNIWSGSRNGIIYGINTSNSSYNEFNLFNRVESVRYFNNNLYVAAQVDSNFSIYKIPVNSISSLGTPEKFFDVTSTFGDKQLIPKSLTLDRDENIYLAIDAPNTSMIRINSSGNYEPFYNEVMNYRVTNIAWGNNNYLYATVLLENDVTTTSDDESKIVKIDMKDKRSAPYYGRGDL